MVWEMSAAARLIQPVYGNIVIVKVPLLTDEVDAVFGTSQLQNQILYIILNTQNLVKSN